MKILKITVKLIIFISLVMPAFSYARGFGGEGHADEKANKEAYKNGDNNGDKNGDKNGEKKDKEDKDKKNKVGALTGEFTITTNYMSIGISQTSNLPAIQGGLTYTVFQSGLYFNIWGSNVRFPDYDWKIATLELDTAIGFTNSFKDNINFEYDISFYRYNYPGARGVSYNELLTDFRYYFITTEINYTNDLYGTDRSGLYVNLGIEYKIPPRYVACIKDLTFTAHIGRYFQPTDFDLGLHSYTDYLVMLEKDIGIYTIAVLVASTNGQAYVPDSVQSRKLVLKVTANF